MSKHLEKPSPDDQVINRCFRRSYIFIPTETPVKHVALFGNQLQALITGEVTEIRFLQFGHEKRNGYRVTVETEVECPDDDDNDPLDQTSIDDAEIESSGDDF